LGSVPKSRKKRERDTQGRTRGWKDEACNGQMLPTWCFAPSPTSAPATQGTTGEISSHPSALLLHYPTPLQVCLVSREPDLWVGKCSGNTSPALGQGMTASPPWEREWLVPAFSAAGFPAGRGWWCATCFHVLPPCPASLSCLCVHSEQGTSMSIAPLGSCRGRHAVQVPSAGLATPVSG